MDFHRFALMLLNGGELDGVRLLRPETVRMMTSNQVGLAFPASGDGWGFGVRVRGEEGAGTEPPSGSFGWVGGTGTAFEVDSESGLIAIVFLPTWPGTSGVSQVRNDFVRSAVATRHAARPSR